jgi:predicted sulfurtransferase
MSMQSCIVDGQPLLETAYKYLPETDVNHVLSQVGEDGVAPNVDLRLALVTNLLNNPICESCGNKSTPNQLMLCRHCCLAWYCNDTCAHNHDNLHRQRCRNQHGPLNQGYQAISLSKRIPDK